MALPKNNHPQRRAHVFGYDDANNQWVPLAVDSSGAVSTNDSTPLSDTPEFFADTSFVVGDSPATLDLNAALGRNATVTEVINDGPGNFTVAYSTDGSTFGDAITVKQRESLRFIDVSVDSIRITHVADSAYRVIAI